jgi:hypothetical protein
MIVDLSLRVRVFDLSRQSSKRALSCHTIATPSKAVTRNGVGAAVGFRPTGHSGAGRVALPQLCP